MFGANKKKFETGTLDCGGWALLGNASRRSGASLLCPALHLTRSFLFCGPTHCSRACFEVDG